MKFDELLKFDSSLELVNPSIWDNEIDGLTDINHLKPNHIIFIKARNFLELALDRLSQDVSKQVGVIISSSLFAKGGEEISQLKEGYGFIATSENIDLSISYLSKTFYLRKAESLNHIVDGRKSGNVEIHPSAQIAESSFIAEGVVIGQNVKIHSGCVIQSGSKVGEGSELFPNVTIYPNVSIGENCRLHSGAIIGADGFGYNLKDGIHHKVWHFGGVDIGNDVEVGACSAIDGGTFSPTIIGDGCKLDNHVQVGHNCILGLGVVLCGHTAIGGSTELGDFTVFGGKSGTGHNLRLGKNCQIAGGALVNCSWPDGSVIGGHPARPLKEWMKGLAYVRKQSLAKKETVL